MKLFLTGEGPTDCGSEGQNGWNDGIFIEIAENSDLHTLCTNCPISFGDFYQQCIQLMAEKQPL